MTILIQLREEPCFKLYKAAIWLIILSITIITAACDNGSDTLTIKADGIEIKLFTYRPNCDNPSILFVFHGLNRNAKNARDNAKSIARDACLMVFAPLFDKERFPNWRYHRAGIIRKSQVQPPSQWTISVLQALIAFSRDHIRNHDANIYLFGHSAGGQFLSRIVAYTTFTDVDRIIIANPSVYVAPTLTEQVPYGFADIFDDAEARKRLALYLSSPVTIYLGKKDIGDKYLVKNHMAERQGSNRYERGRNIYYSAKQQALRLGIPFSWKLVEACNIGHSSAGMLNADEMFYALGLRNNISSDIHLCEN